MKNVTPLAGLGLLGAALSLPAAGQDAPPADVNTGALTFSLGADITTNYIFRGYEQEDSGLILQPYAEVGAPIGDTGVDFYAGVWNSIHSEQTLADGNGAKDFYETDLYVGVAFAVAEKFGIDISYVGYFYPNGAFNDIHELDIAVSYDDSDDLGDFALSPYVLLAIEFDDANGSEDTYIEFGGELSLDAFVPTSEDFDVSLSVPFALGLGVDNYYPDNDLFGYFSVGVFGSIPLEFIPSEYGAWEAHAGLTGYFFNDGAGLTDSDEDFQLVASIGIGLEY